MKNMHLSGADHSGETIRRQSIAGLHLTDVAYGSGTRVPNHYHNHACFCLVENGGYTESYRRKTIDCRPSQIIFRPAEELHADHFGSSGAKCFIIEFGSDWLTRIDEYSAWIHEPTHFQN